MIDFDLFVPRNILVPEITQVSHILVPVSLHIGHSNGFQTLVYRSLYQRKLTVKWAVFRLLEASKWVERMLSNLRRRCGFGQRCIVGWDKGWSLARPNAFLLGAGVKYRTILLCEKCYNGEKEGYARNSPFEYDIMIRAYCQVGTVRAYATSSSVTGRVIALKHWITEEIGFHICKVHSLLSVFVPLNSAIITNTWKILKSLLTHRFRYWQNGRNNTKWHIFMRNLGTIGQILKDWRGEHGLICR